MHFRLYIQYEKFDPADNIVDMLTDMIDLSRSYDVIHPERLPARFKRKFDC